MLRVGGSANWPNALSAAWQAAQTLLLEHGSRCWWLPMLQLEQQQLRHLLHAVKAAQDMMDGWHEGVGAGGGEEGVGRGVCWEQGWGQWDERS